MDSDSKSHDKNMSENSNSCKVMSELLLPQDLMLHIFHLLPIYCLIDSARYVSKHWADTFNQLDGRRLRSTPGILVENRLSKGNFYFLEFKDDVNAGFETIYLPTPPNMGFLMGTCHGILMLLAPDGHIFLANPILKCWLRLPRFPGSEKFGSIMDQCTITCVPRTAKFKLFFQDIIYVSEIARKAPLHRDVSGKPLYSGGNDLYWVASEIIVINVDKEIIVREYPLPLYLSDNLMYMDLALLWTGTHLSCIVTELSYKAYQIHILDFDSGKWSLYHEMRPFDYMPVCGHNLIIPKGSKNVEFLEFLLWIGDQIIFVVTLSEGITMTDIHVAYNVKTKQFTKIQGIGDSHHRVWLHTNTLLSLSTAPA